VVGQLQKTRIRGEEIRITRVDSKPDKPKFSGKSRRPDRMAEASFERKGGERKPYMGGGSRFKKEGGYQGTPRYADKHADKVASLPQEFRDQERGPSGERPRFERRERPAFGDKPSFRKEGFKPAFKKEGSFKKKFTGKAAGAKGAYKGGKAFREKSR
jgi:hypothetical protein